MSYGQPKVPSLLCMQDQSRRHRHGTGMVCLVLLLTLLCPPPAWSAPKGKSRLFNSIALRTPSDRQRDRLEQLMLAHPDQGLKRAAADWRQMIDASRPLPTASQLQHINRRINSRPYRPEAVDDWASPMTLWTGGGDCEDFSIAKYCALRELGYPAEALRIVVVQDEVLQADHAVLAVTQEQDILILDNRSDAVLSHRRYNHYRPLFSLNEHQRWAHARLNPPDK